MMDTVHTVYERQVKPLSVADRLQLVRLIMEDLTESVSRWAVDIADEWSQEDLHDLGQASFLYATQVLADEEEDASSR
jgi:hypothetical protein